MLKPLYGDEPLLDEALASFCEQDYPTFQIVFGVQSAADPALAVVDLIRTRFPHVDIDVVVDATRHGRNGKVGNLINMVQVARHDVLVISDSDIHAPANTLRSVVAALATTITGSSAIRPRRVVQHPSQNTLPPTMGSLLFQVFTCCIRKRSLSPVSSGVPLLVSVSSPHLTSGRTQ